MDSKFRTPFVGTVVPRPNLPMPVVHTSFDLAVPSDPSFHRNHHLLYSSCTSLIYYRIGRKAELNATARVRYVILSGFTFIEMIQDSPFQ